MRVFTDEVQSLWDPGQQVVPQGVINGDAKISGAGQKGGLRAAAAHTQYIGNTQRSQPVLHIYIYTHTHTHTHTHRWMDGKLHEILALSIEKEMMVVLSY